MDELWAYRERLLRCHAQQVVALRKAVRRFPARRWGLAGPDGGWSAQQVLAHVRDVEVQAYVPRVHRLLAEPDPLLADFDAEAFLAEHYDPGEAPGQMLDDIDRARRALRDALRPDDGRAWSRTGRHPALGIRSVQTWVERAVAHCEEHLRQLEALRGGAGRRGKP